MSKTNDIKTNDIKMNIWHCDIDNLWGVGEWKIIEVNEMTFLEKIIFKLKRLYEI